MSNSNQDANLARTALIDLLGDIDKWEITDRALREGRIALHWLKARDLTRFEICDYIRQRLVDGFPIEPVLLGEPPGSAGVGWVMKNPDGRDTYIKLKIEEDGVFDIVIILSCHTSVHRQK